MDEKDDLARQFEARITLTRLDKVVALLGMALLTVLVFVLVGALSGAPLPLPRPPKPPSAEWVNGLATVDLCGDWKMTWASDHYYYTFSRDGRSFGENEPGAETWYVGTWAIDSEGRLEVTEVHRSRGGDLGVVQTWRVEWNRDEAGRLSRLRPAGKASYRPHEYAVAFALERRK